MVEAFSGLELLLLLQFILCRSSNTFPTNPTFGNVSAGELVSTGYTGLLGKLYDLIVKLRQGSGKDRQGMALTVVEQCTYFL